MEPSGRPRWFLAGLSHFGARIAGAVRRRHVEAEAPTSQQLASAELPQPHGRRDAAAEALQKAQARAENARAAKRLKRERRQETRDAFSGRIQANAVAARQEQCKARRLNAPRRNMRGFGWVCLVIT